MEILGNRSGSKPIWYKLSNITVVIDAITLFVMMINRNLRVTIFVMDPSHEGMTSFKILYFATILSLGSPF